MDNKRQDIIDKSGQIFLKFGIKSVTMDDLARELVISKKTLYQYFNDKNELVNEIIKQKIEISEKLCFESCSCAENAIDELFKISVHITGLIKNIHPSVFYDLRKFHPDAWNIIYNHRLNFAKKSIYDNIKRGKNEKLYRDELNEEIITNVYISSTELFTGSDTFINIEKNTDQIFLEILSFIIHGLVNEKGLIYLKNKLNEIQ